MQRLQVHFNNTLGGAGETLSPRSPGGQQAKTAAATRPPQVQRRGPPAGRRASLRTRSQHRERVDSLTSTVETPSPSSSLPPGPDLFELERLRQALSETLERFAFEEKKSQDNASRITQWEETLRSLEVRLEEENSQHASAMAEQAARLEALEKEYFSLMETAKELDEASAVELDGDSLAEQARELRMEQVANFVVSAPKGHKGYLHGLEAALEEMIITAKDIGRDLTGTATKAAALYIPNETTAAKMIQQTQTKRRQLWENYELLWARSDDASCIPRYGTQDHRYQVMLRQHHARWNKVVLNRCAGEYMDQKLVELGLVAAPPAGSADSDIASVALNNNQGSGRLQNSNPHLPLEDASHTAAPVAPQQPSSSLPRGASNARRVVVVVE